MSYQRPTIPAGGLRLHFNENTAGCSPAVLAALRSIEREDTAFYPDYEPITAQCEQWFGVAPGWVQLLNGLDEGLHVVAQWAARAIGAADLQVRGQSPGPKGPGLRQHVLIVDPAFEMYQACADACGLQSAHMAPKLGFAFPLDEILAALTPDTRVVYLTDPNNPTGLPIPAGAVETIAAAAPDAIVLVDEAYAEFSGRTLIGDLLDRRRNVVIGRTFAKAHGLAALRVGALIAHRDTLDTLRPLLPPYSLNICAIRALGAALSDRAYLDWYVSESVESRRLIEAFCRDRQLAFWRSEANFVLFRVGDRATAITADLAARGIFVRDKSGAPGCAGCIRLTAGIVLHTAAALAALGEILETRTH
jgi:histidinol-phosphate aminotransferase